MGLFLKKGVEIDAFTDIVDSKNGLSERIQVSLTAVCADLPAALHKQHKNVDVTEMQLQFTWQFDAAYSHMTTHWFYFYLHADIYVKKSIRQTALISIDWQSDNWILFTFQHDWQLDT